MGVGVSMTEVSELWAKAKRSHSRLEEKIKNALKTANGKKPNKRKDDDKDGDDDNDDDGDQKEFKDQIPLELLGVSLQEEHISSEAPSNLILLFFLRGCLWHKSICVFVSSRQWLK